MSFKKYFNISRFINIVLAAVLIFSFYQFQTIRNQVVTYEIQNNLVELESVIAYQVRGNWSEPVLVTKQLGDVLDGVWLVLSTTEKAAFLSDADKEALDELHAKLRQFPGDELYITTEITRGDIRSFEELRLHLHKAGFYSDNNRLDSGLKGFMDRAATLDRLLESQT